MKILCLHIAENQASYRYRVERFLPHWRQYGIEIHPVCIVGKNYPEKLKLALESRHYDFVWLQRKPLAPFLVDIIASRSRLIYDFDDALYTRQTGHTGRLKSTKPGSGKMVKRINHVLKKASLVFAGSDALAEYAEKFNPAAVRLIPTSYQTADTDGEAIPAAANPHVTVGWIGGNGTLPYLKLIDEATSALQRTLPGIRFSVMSGRPPEGLQTDWHFEPWSLESEKNWLRSIDIGIMPLLDDEWSRGKCAFKLIQYMAYAKPVIASAVGANTTTVSHGRNGFLATTIEEWIAALNSLAGDSGLRKSMGAESEKIFLSTFERSRVQQTIADMLHKELRQQQ